MTPIAICVVGLAVAGFSSAQSTVSLFIPGADLQPLVASIVGSDATATTYAIQCVPGTDSSDCGISGVVTLTEGPSTAVYTMSDGMGGGAFTGYFDCSLAGATSAVCIESFGGSEANDPGMATETVNGTDFFYMPVTITAGAGGSTSGSSSSSTPQSQSMVSTTSGTSGTTVKSTSSGGASSGASQTASAKSSTSTAGVPAVTGNAQWVVAGAAVALALAA